MDTLLLILTVTGGIVSLWLIVKLLGSCLLRVLLTLAVLALAAFIFFSVVRS